MPTPATAKPTLHGHDVILRPADERHLPRLFEILAEPAVGEWWQRQEPSDLLPDPHEGAGFVVEVAEQIAGWAGYYEENDRDYRHAGIDLFLASAYQNRGLGRDVLRTLATYLFDGRHHHRLVIDPAVANVRATHVYEAIGFRRVGVMRQYERSPEGVWRDGLLMDMLRGELR